MFIFIVSAAQFGLYLMNIYSQMCVLNYIWYCYSLLMQKPKWCRMLLWLKIQICYWFLLMAQYDALCLCSMSILYVYALCLHCCSSKNIILITQRLSIIVMTNGLLLEQQELDIIKKLTSTTWCCGGTLNCRFSCSWASTELSCSITLVFTGTMKL